MVIKDPRFNLCERIHTIDFSLFLEIKTLDILSVPNRKLVENILHTFCLG